MKAIKKNPIKNFKFYAILFVLSGLLFACGANKQFNMADDVYVVKPSNLSVDEKSSDETSYAAFKQRKRKTVSEQLVYGYSGTKPGVDDITLCRMERYWYPGCGCSRDTWYFYSFYSPMNNFQFYNSRYSNFAFTTGIMYGVPQMNIGYGNQYAYYGSNPYFGYGGFPYYGNYYSQYGNYPYAGYGGTNSSAGYNIYKPRNNRGSGYYNRRGSQNSNYGKSGMPISTNNLRKGKSAEASSNRVPVNKVNSYSKVRRHEGNRSVETLRSLPAERTNASQRKYNNYSYSTAQRNVRQPVRRTNNTMRSNSRTPNVSQNTSIRGGSSFGTRSNSRSNSTRPSGSSNSNRGGRSGGTSTGGRR